MPPVSKRLGWLAVLTASLLACACGQPPDDSPEQPIGERLVGTWLREYHEGAVEVRRVLVLSPDGRFREMASVASAGASVAEHDHSGEWVFDGTNLKRHYRRMDGRQPSAPMIPFVTFELSFPSPDEFIGIDRVRKHQVRYRRVGDGTLP